MGELVRLVDTDRRGRRRIGGPWPRAELGDLLEALPAEVTAGVATGDVLRLDDLADLRALLHGCRSDGAGAPGGGAERTHEAARLLLQAFGPFTDKELDFADDGARESICT